MTKHPLDRPRKASSARTERFVGLERAGTPHPATKALQQRTRGEKAETRVPIYTRIERRGEE